MARIPFQNETSTQVQSARFGSIQNTASVEDFAGPESELAKLAGVASDAVQKFAIQKQNQLDLQAVQNTTAAWKEVEFERGNALEARKGEGAKGSLDRAKAWWDNGGATIGDTGGVIMEETFDESGNVTGYRETTHEAAEPIQTSAYTKYQKMYEGLDDRQKTAVDVMRSNRRADFLNRAMKHETVERIKGTIRSSNAIIATSTQAALAQYDNPKVVQDELNDITNAIDAVAKVEGWGQEKIDEERLKQVAAVHDGIVNLYLAEGTGKDENGMDGVDRAKAYYKEHKKEFPKTGQLNIEKAIRKKEIYVKGSGHAKTALAMPLEKAVEYLNGINDVEVFDKAMSLYRQGSVFAGKKATAEKEQYKASVAEWIRKGNGNSIDNLPPELSGKTDMLEDTDIIRYDSYARTIAGRGPNVTFDQDWKTQDRVSRLMTTPAGRNQLKGEDIGLMYHDKAFPETITKIRSIQDKLRKGDDSLIKWNTRITAAMNDAGWIGDDYARHRGKTMEIFIAKVDEYEELNGKAPQGKVLQDMVKETMSVKHVTEMSKFDPLEDVNEIKQDFTPNQVIDNAIKGLGIDTTAGNAAGEKTESDLKAFAMEKVDRINKNRDGKRDRSGKPMKPVSTEEAQKIIDTIIEDKVLTDMNYFEADDPDKEDIKTMAEIEKNPDLYPRENVFVYSTDENGNRHAVYLKDIDALPRETKNRIGKFLEEHNFKMTIQNIADAWLGSSDARIKSRPADVDRLGNIRNPNGKEQANLTTMRTQVADDSPDDLIKRRPDIGKKFGPVAQKVFDRMAIRKIVAHGDSVDNMELEKRQQIAREFGNEGLKYYDLQALRKMEQEKARSK